MTARRSGSLTAQELLADFAPEVRELAERLRGLVREQVPGATERVYPGWRGIGYRDGQAGYFCGIFPQRDHVRLLFEHGASFADPPALLQGQGGQTRYVRMNPGEPPPDSEIRELVEQALRYGAIRSTA